MNNVKFIGAESFIEGQHDFLRELGFSEETEGRPIVLEQTDAPILQVEKMQTSVIRYHDQVQIIRGLLIWKQLQEEQTNDEVVNFRRMGPMLDLSRNAVMKPEAMKQFLRRIARLGLNTCMLYMEDVYEVPEYPYFGYMRGRYTLAELRDLDDFAAALGIELIPAIQTLGHLLLPLKWGFSKAFQDTRDILLVGEEQTYTFIDHLLRQISQAFRSKRIHIGMDEAWTLGSGMYLKKNGYHPQFEIMTQHLKRVLALTKKYGLEPMIWSDMFFRANSATADYYDEAVNFTDEMIKAVPDVELTLWDYYHVDPTIYERLLKRHYQLSDKVSFAGGVWTWNGLAPNYGKTIATTQAGLAAAKKMQVKDIYATLWGDDGQETSVDTSWFGLALFAQYQYAAEPSLEGAKKDLAILLNENAEDYLLLNRFDEVPGITEGNPGAASPSKAMLYQDLLLLLFDENLKAYDYRQYYQRLAQTLRQQHNDSLMYQFYIQLAETLTVKIDLSRQIRTAYQSRDTTAMQAVIDKLSSLIKSFRTLRAAHFVLWRKNYRDFGWEVLDIRYGGLCQRFETTQTILGEWVTDPSIRIEELEQTLLPYDDGTKLPEDVVGNAYFGRIVTPSELSGV
ncbi:beta-N-acetylhexosaminidase [Lacticaseibacillus yichunensis]|uniref:Beta-N-acetylhexosaminidase n=1 Tax=Lacticaseibacillus yichunensis TaxID=2486015 RepID=A0ABW4CS52_9LACO|nr:beta-N-acetylhexosaminidase [Lacticaseibacillus yichunensis]